MHGTCIKMTSQIHIIFQHSPSCINTKIQTTLPFLLAFYRPTHALDKKNLCYCFSVLKFGKKKRSAGLGSGLLGSCVSQWSSCFAPETSNCWALYARERCGGGDRTSHVPAQVSGRFFAHSSRTPTNGHLFTMWPLQRTNNIPNIDRPRR